MWHHPDRVLRQFGMEQPIPRTEMMESEVTRLLGLTRRREIGMRETMQQYLARGMPAIITLQRQVQSDTQSVGISTTST
ncbi:hypothetical protein LINGRAHAP2_LOCUS24556 [Linum grandiflorum]